MHKVILPWMLLSFWKMVNFFLFLSVLTGSLVASLASGDKVGVKSVDKEIVMAKWQLETRRDTIFESERPGIKDFKSINFMMHLIEGNESKW